MTKEEFLEHNIHQKISQFLERLHEDEVKDNLEVDKLDFFISACIYVSDRLNLCLPTLTSLSDLTSISGEFEKSLNQVNSFIGNGNSGHINNATAYITTALTTVRNLPIPYKKGDLDFSKSVANFQNLITDKLKITENYQKELETKIETSETQISEQEKEIQRLAELITEKEKEIEKLNKNFETKFDTSASQFNKIVEEDRTEFKETFDTDREKLQTETNKIIKELQDKLNDAKRLVNVIGNVGVTGNYQNIANEHKLTADNWRKIAIGFMCVLSTLLVFSIWKIGNIDYDWHKAIIRIIASAILIYPATYASRESSKHRKLENLNRKLELELAAINPFIEIIDENKKQEIKEKLVEKYFGNNQQAELSNEKDENISVDILGKVIKLITDIKK